MARGKNDASLLDGTNTRCRTAMARAAALAHLDKDRGAVGRAHDQVNFATAAPGRPIIALQKTQTVPLQELQRCIFSRVPGLFGACGPGLVVRKNH